MPYSNTYNPFYISHPPIASAQFAAIHKTPSANFLVQALTVQNPTNTPISNHIFHLYTAAYHTSSQLTVLFLSHLLHTAFIPPPDYIGYSNQRCKLSSLTFVPPLPHRQQSSYTQNSGVFLLFITSWPTITSSLHRLQYYCILYSGAIATKFFKKTNYSISQANYTSIKL